MLSTVLFNFCSSWDIVICRTNCINGWTWRLCKWNLQWIAPHTPPGSWNRISTYTSKFLFCYLCLHYIVKACSVCLTCFVGCRFWSAWLLWLLLETVILTKLKDRWKSYGSILIRYLLKLFSVKHILIVKILSYWWSLPCIWLMLLHTAVFIVYSMELDGLIFLC